MSRIQLVGVDGSNPLGFLATLGLLRIVPGVKLGFSEDGSFQAFVNGLDKRESYLASLVAADAEDAATENAPWRFTYTKTATKKQGPKKVADLKAPLAVGRIHLRRVDRVFGALAARQFIHPRA